MPLPSLIVASFMNLAFYKKSLLLALALVFGTQNDILTAALLRSSSYEGLWLRRAYFATIL